MKTSYLILAAIGAGVVLLLTNDKAKGMGKDMLSNAGDLKDKLSKLFVDMSGEMKNLTKSLTKQAGQLATDATEKVTS